MGRLLDHISSDEFKAEQEKREQERLDAIEKSHKKESVRQEKHKAWRKKNIIKKSYTDLCKNGWKESTKPILAPNTYPATTHVVLENPAHDYALVLAFREYEDSSDWPGNDAIVEWTKCDIVERVVLDIEIRK